MIDAGRRFRPLAFFGVATAVALVFHIGFVSMTGGSVLAALDGQTLLFFALPVLLVPAIVTLTLLFGPLAWRRNRLAMTIACGAMMLHGTAVAIWIASLTDGLSQAYGVIFMFPALLGVIATGLSLVIARPFRV